MSVISEKLKTDAYTSKLPYPSKPFKPAVFNKRASDLTSAELTSMVAVRQQYETELDAYKEGVAAWREDSSRLAAEFRADLEHQYGMVGHPKADMLYSKAYELGHSAGFSDVHHYYSDLVDLVL